MVSANNFVIKQATTGSVANSGESFLTHLFQAGQQFTNKWKVFEEKVAL